MTTNTYLRSNWEPNHGQKAFWKIGQGYHQSFKEQEILKDPSVVKILSDLETKVSDLSFLQKMRDSLELRIFKLTRRKP